MTLAPIVRHSSTAAITPAVRSISDIRQTLANQKSKLICIRIDARNTDVVASNGTDITHTVCAMAVEIYIPTFVSTVRAGSGDTMSDVRQVGVPQAISSINIANNDRDGPYCTS